MSSVEAKRKGKWLYFYTVVGRSVGKENTGKDIFNTEALDDEILVQGSLAKELKGSIFTPKIVDGPRVRRSTAAPTNQQPVVKQPTLPKKPKKAESKIVEKKEPKKETKPKVTKQSPPKPKPVESMDSIDDEDDLEFSGSKTTRPAILPSVIAMELEAINALKEPKTKQLKPEPVAASPVKVIPVAHHEPPKVTPLSAPVMPSDIPVLVDYKAAYETMKEKFERLNLLRTTEAEKLLSDYKKTFTAQKQSTNISLLILFLGADQLINGLKSENERLKAQIQQLTTNSRRDSNVSVTSTASTQSSTADQLQTLSRLADLYRELSGLEMESVSEWTWKCCLSGRLGSLNFTLHFDEDAESFEYTPQVPSNSPLVSVLPAYLLEDISFGPEQLQLFFWRAMNFLMTSES